MNKVTTSPSDKKADEMKASKDFKSAPKVGVASPPADTSGMTSKPSTCGSAEGKEEACGKTHEGKVVSITGNKLVMSGHDGKEHTHDVAVDAQVCCDGVLCRTADLKSGSRIRVTTKSGDKRVATKIESLNKQADFTKSA